MKIIQLFSLSLFFDRYNEAINLIIFQKPLSNNFFLELRKLLSIQNKTENFILKKNQNRTIKLLFLRRSTLQFLIMKLCCRKNCNLKYQYNFCIFLVLYLLLLKQAILNLQFCVNLIICVKLHLSIGTVIMLKNYKNLGYNIFNYKIMFLFICLDLRKFKFRCSICM